MGPPLATRRRYNEDFTLTSGSAVNLVNYLQFYNIFRAYRRFKTTVINTTRNLCIPDRLHDFYSNNASLYLSSAFHIAIDAVDQLDTTACAS